MQCAQQQQTLRRAQQLPSSACCRLPCAPTRRLAARRRAPTGRRHWRPRTAPLVNWRRHWPAGSARWCAARQTNMQNACERPVATLRGHAVTPCGTAMLLLQDAASRQASAGQEELAAGRSSAQGRVAALEAALSEARATVRGSCRSSLACSNQDMQQVELDVDTGVCCCCCCCRRCLSQSCCLSRRASWTRHAWQQSRVVLQATLEHGRCSRVSRGLLGACTHQMQQQQRNHVLICRCCCCGCCRAGCHPGGAGPSGARAEAAACAGGREGRTAGGCCPRAAGDAAAAGAHRPAAAGCR